MATLAEFRHDLISAQESDADVDYRRAVFIEKACDILRRRDVIDEVIPCHWQGKGGPRSRNVAVSAAAFNDSDSSVTIVLAHFDGTPEEPPVLSATEAGRLLKMAIGFVELSVAGSLNGLTDANSAVLELIQQLYGRRDVIGKARILLVTDGRLSGRVRELEPEAAGTIMCELHVWDVARLHELEASGHEPVEIDLVHEFGRGIPCLAAHLGTDEYKAYLCVVPGALIADLYGRYGARLLETNVRGFLSDRGKVNRGMRATIQNRPAMFFAFNNGLTATASSVRLADARGEKQIVHLSDLQIVNGGQTTASMFWARKKHKASLDTIFVQMKLSVIPDEHTEQLDRIVTDIAKLANSQNKVSDADLFSNHPFHRELEKISRRTGISAQRGGQYQTYWFYERARAQYANERAALSTAETKLFDQKYPKAQCIDKTELAKFLNAWDRVPHLVSSGAQKSFKQFAEQITARWERNPDQFNEVFYKRAISIAIIYKTLERLVQKQEWYEAHRAAVVAYTVSVLSNAIEISGKRLNLLRIWEEQALSSEAEAAAIELARQVWFALKDHEKRRERAQWGNLGEWFKSRECWDIARQLVVELGTGFRRLLIDPDQYDRQERGGQRDQRMVTSITAQSEVIELHESGYWQRLKDWNQEDPVLSEEEERVLRKALSWLPGRVLDEYDSRRLIAAKQRAESNGFAI
jgi:hypothetical protein